MDSKPTYLEEPEEKEYKPTLGTQLLSMSDTEKLNQLILNLDIMIQKQGETTLEIKELTKCFNRTVDDVHNVKIWKKDIEEWKSKTDVSLSKMSSELEDLKVIKKAVTTELQKKDWKRDIRNSFITAFVTSISILSALAVIGDTMRSFFSK